MSGTTDWFSAGFRGCMPHSTREIFVRVWEPGDGLRCSSAGYNRRIPCGEPAAVLKQVLQQVPSKNCSQSVTRVLCLRHLASEFDPQLGTPAEHDVERKALEELASRYWDQFFEIKNRMQNELLQERFSALPNDLRDSVIALVNEAEDMQ